MAASCIGGRGHQGSVRKLAAKMIDAGKSYQDIADKLGVSRQRIGQIAKSLGVDRRAHGEFVRSGWFLKRQKEAAERRERRGCGAGSKESGRARETSRSGGPGSSSPAEGTVCP